MNDIDRRFATRVRAIREARHWSAQDLANKTGLSRVAISKLENGCRGVGLGEAVDLAHALGAPLDDMIKPGTLSVHTTIDYKIVSGPGDPQP